MLVPRAERHPRQGRRPDPALQTRGLFRTGIRGFQRRHVESGEQLFKDYLDASAALFAAGTPILFTRGNHETRGVFADSLGDYFPGRDGRFYGIYRYGDVCILLLDCGEDKPDDHAEYNGLADYDAYRAEECAWLKKAVRSAQLVRPKEAFSMLQPP